MKLNLFIKRTFSIFSFFVIISLVLIFFTPTSNSLLDALPEKHSALEKTGNKKILLVGGSNLSMGLNTEKVSDEFSLPAYNSGIHAGLGLKFMLDDIIPYIHSGDYVVLVPEYQHLISEKTFYGDKELAYVLMNYFPKRIKGLSIKQLKNLAPYFLDQIRQNVKEVIFLRFLFKKSHQTWYLVDAYNSYGDVDKHWGQKPRQVIPFAPSTGKEKVLDDSIYELLKFCALMKSNHVNVKILPPVIQSTSYNNMSYSIKMIEESLLKNRICDSYDTKRYCLEDKYFFDTPYHCTKEGVDIRTRLVIEDLKKVIPIPSELPTGTSD